MYMGHCTVAGLSFIYFFTDLSRWSLSQLCVMADNTTGGVASSLQGTLAEGYLDSALKAIWQLPLLVEHLPCNRALYDNSVFL